MGLTEQEEGVGFPRDRSYEDKMKTPVIRIVIAGSD